MTVLSAQVAPAPKAVEPPPHFLVAAAEGGPSQQAAAALMAVAVRLSLPLAAAGVLQRYLERPIPLKKRLWRQALRGPESKSWNADPF
jgi:hypothetical protein